jgi:hypothetical protein
MGFPLPLPIGCRECGKRKREVADAEAWRGRVGGFGDFENCPDVGHDEAVIAVFQRAVRL